MNGKTVDDFFVVRRMLLVEDSATSALLVKSVFADEAEVVHRETLADGLECARQIDVDVVLLDLTLPDSIGLDSLRRFREHFPDLPLVVLTGNSDEATGREALQLGAQDYLIKDETYPRLLRRQTNYAVHRKLEQLALRDAKERAEESARLRDKFVSMVAHDLRGPLGSMVGLAEVLFDDPEVELEPEQRKMLGHIVTTGAGLLRVVEELLDIGRLQLGTVSPRPRFLDAHYLVKQIVQRLEPQALAKGIEVDNQVAAGCRLYADPVLIGQVLQNLIGNAIKFSHPGARVRVYRPPTGPAALAVQDKGVGIPDDVLPRLFRVEEKISTLGTGGEKGTGLGLPYCAGIMEAHGGRLWLESREGAGSTFYAELPEVVPRVLVVDDQASARQALLATLAELKLDISEAAGGAEALDILERRPPHLVLLDIVMADMDGFAFLEAVADNPVVAGLPIIVVTGDGKMETRERAFALGAADFTVKPVVAQDLIPRVRHFVG